MENVFAAFIDLINGIIAFYHSVFFSIVKFALGIYVAVMIIDIILMLIQRGVSGDVRQTTLGINFPVELVRKKAKIKLRQKWQEIKSNIASDDQAKYKLTIIEADGLIDNLIMRMGYPGENLGERLEGVYPGQIENVEDLKKAHSVRNRIIHDEQFSMTKKEALEALKPFEEFLSYYNVLS